MDYVRTIHDLETGKIMVIDDGTAPVDYSEQYWQENHVFEDQLPLLLSLGIDEDDFNNKTKDYFKNMTPEEIQVIKHIAAGRKFIIEILNQIKNMEELTINQRLQLLSTIKDPLNSLLWGDPEVSRAAFAATATTTLFTQTRKDWILAQIDAYINSLQ